MLLSIYRPCLIYIICKCLLSYSYNSPSRPVEREIKGRPLLFRLVQGNARVDVRILKLQNDSTLYSIFINMKDFNFALHCQQRYAFKLYSYIMHFVCLFYLSVLICIHKLCCYWSCPTPFRSYPSTFSYVRWFPPARVRPRYVVSTSSCIV